MRHSSVCIECFSIGPHSNVARDEVSSRALILLQARSSSRLFVAIVTFFIHGSNSFSAGPSIDPSTFINSDDTLSQSAVSGIILSVGVISDHRPYQPATPLTKSGFDFGISASLVQVPSVFYSGLVETGNASNKIPFLPDARFIIHKGIGDKVDLGFSIFYIKGYHLFGYELKIVLDHPEEGLTWATRLSYNTTYLGISKNGITASIDTQTLTPQLIVSRKIIFADPYVGIGYQWVQGTVKAAIKVPGVLDQSGIAGGTGSSYLVFMGVGLKIPYSAFKITLEGAYNSIGANSLGTKIGFNF